MAAMTQTVKPHKRTFGQWARSRDGQKVFVMVAFMIIPLVLLFLFTYLPFAEMFGFSFYNMKYVGARKFVGFMMIGFHLKRKIILLVKYERKKRLVY